MDPIFTLNDAALLNFAPPIRNNIREIYRDGKIGLSHLKIKVHVPATKSLPGDYKTNYKDNFTLEIPYAGKLLYWEVSFKDEDYDFPPDFDFMDDFFLHDPDVDVILKHIPSLANWNIDDSKSLMCVVRELMVLYKKYQVSKLETDNKYAILYTEYQYLITEINDAENNVEVYIDNYGTVNFLICIKINFSELPPYVQPVLLGVADNILNPFEDAAILRIVLKPDSLDSHSSLLLSPRLEQVIGSASVLHIPAFNKDNTLYNYVVQITNLLQERVEQLSNNYKLRNEYISFILSICGSNIIEYDSTLFSKVILLCEVNTFYVLVFIFIGDKFPKEKPKVTLRSCYHLQHDKPIVHVLDNYPYSPRWTPEEMVKRLIIHVKEQVPKFKKLTGA